MGNKLNIPSVYLGPLERGPALKFFPKCIFNGLSDSFKKGDFEMLMKVPPENFPPSNYFCLLNIIFFC